MPGLALLRLLAICHTRLKCLSSAISSVDSLSSINLVTDAVTFFGMSFYVCLRVGEIKTHCSVQCNCENE